MKFVSFDELLSFNAAHYPDNPALIFEENGVKTSINYNQLYSQVLKRKEEYLALKVKCVAQLGAASADWIIDTFAAVLAGKQTVLLEPSLEPEILQKLVIYADVDHIHADTASEETAKGLKLAPGTDVRTEGGEGKLLFFTSGTTAMSKAVVLTSKSLCASAWNGQQKLKCYPEDNLLCLLPLNHVFGFVCAMLWPLSQGAAVSIGRGMRFYMTDCDYFRPTLISVVPTLIKFLIGMKVLNKELHTILVGAGPADERALAAAKAMGYEVRFGYGLTETSSGVAISCGEDPFAMDVCPDDRITIADDGEILIYSPECMMQGYYKDLKATSEALRDGVLYTGDIGELDESGRLRVTGRKKDVLALENGNKIYLPEWEEELGAYLGVEELAIKLTDGKPTAVVVDKENKYDIESLKNKLSEFNREKPIDKRITLIVKRETPLPRTATGKIRRWAF